jgi:hypothetical protein
VDPSVLARAASPRTAWGQPPSAVESSEVRPPSAASESGTLLRRKPGAAVPREFVVHSASDALIGVPSASPVVGG